MLAYAGRETLEIRRDPIRLAFALLGPMLLLIVLGYGISFDVEHLSYGVLDRDQTTMSRNYLENFAGSRYFRERPPLRDYNELDRRMESGKLRVAVEIPPEFAKDLKRGRSPEVSVWIDGAMPSRGETMRAYVQGLHRLYLNNLQRGSPTAAGPARIQFRYRYNQDFQSIYATVPGVIAILLIFFPAILMALGVVREKELGSITNLYATPVTRLEFLLGKQLPYVGIGMLNFFTLIAMAVFLFRVPLKAGLLPAHDGRAALRGGHHRDGPAHFRLHKDATRGALRYGHSHGDAGRSVLRLPDAAVGVDGRCGGDWDALSQHLFHEDQRRSLHQVARVHGAASQLRCARDLHSRVHHPEPGVPSEAGEMTVRRLQNIFRLGIKELRSLRHDTVLLLLVFYAFTYAIYSAATGTSSELRNASVAGVDEDQSLLSGRLTDALLKPYFREPHEILASEIDDAMDSGSYTFVVDIPPDFERDLLRGRQPQLQVNIDATAMLQAGAGASYIQGIVSDELLEFVHRTGSVAPTAARLSRASSSTPT